MSDASSTILRGGFPVSRQQADVIDHLVHHPVTVVGAGAGSGKTHTLVAGVLELIETGRAHLDQFVLITFTNKAADELRERIERALETRIRSAMSDDRRRFWREETERLSSAYVGTIHGLCLRLLRTFGYHERIARESEMTLARHLLNTASQGVLESQINGHLPILLGSPFEWRIHELDAFIKKLYEHIRNQGMNPDEILASTRRQPEDAWKPIRVAVASIVAQLEERYGRLKMEEKRLDASDLLARAVAMLHAPAGSEVARHFCSRYRYMCVDEFQDTDRLQKKILDRLVKHLKGLMVVGDRKQSIYGFRAADVSLLEQLARDHDVEILKLSVSRRPTRSLLATQNALFNTINRNFPGIHEPLETVPGSPEPVKGIAPMTFVACSNGGTVAAIAHSIRQVLDSRMEVQEGSGSRPIEPGDIVVLVRTNGAVTRYCEPVSALLADRGVLVRPDQGGRFFERPEIVATYRMLRFILHAPDDAGLFLALETPYLSTVDATLAIRDRMEAGPDGAATLYRWFIENHPDHAARLLRLREAVLTDTVSQWLARLYDEFDIWSVYHHRDAHEAIDNLEKLRELARALMGNEQALGLREFADWLQLAFETQRDEVDARDESGIERSRPEHVRVMTIHRAKGLEFPVVIVPDVHASLAGSGKEVQFLVHPEDGLDLNLPKLGLHPRQVSRLKENRLTTLAEEMRVLYVAITRAQYAVHFISGSLGRPSNPENSWYSWADEIMKARQDLEPLGMAIIELP